MAQTTQLVFKHTEVVEALLKKQGIHEGIWGLYVRFGLQAANMGPNPNELMPVAIVPLMEIGLQKMDVEGSLAVDAAKVNPQGLPLESAPKK
jgi:hypothetical protein